MHYTCVCVCVFMRFYVCTNVHNEILVGSGAMGASSPMLFNTAFSFIIGMYVYTCVFMWLYVCTNV
jgi:hypothetical protein